MTTSDARQTTPHIRSTTYLPSTFVIVMDVIVIVIVVIVNCHCCYCHCHCCDCYCHWILCFFMFIDVCFHCCAVLVRFHCCFVCVVCLAHSVFGVAHNNSILPSSLVSLSSLSLLSFRMSITRHNNADFERQDTEQSCDKTCDTAPVTNYTTRREMSLCLNQSPGLSLQVASPCLPSNFTADWKLHDVTRRDWITSDNYTI